MHIISIVCQHYSAPWMRGFRVHSGVVSALDSLDSIETLVLHSSNQAIYCGVSFLVTIRLPDEPMSAYFQWCSQLTLAVSFSALIVIVISLNIYH